MPILTHPHMKNCTIVFLLVILGILLLGLGWYYIATPANQLASFIPGYDAAMTTIHTKHAIAAFVLGVGCFLLAWFKSGKGKN